MSPSPAAPPGRIDRKLLRSALRAWNNSSALGESGLARLASVEAHRRAAGYGLTLAGCGLAVREVLRQAIRTLAPADRAPDPFDKAWRANLILTQQYLDGRAPDFVAEWLGLSRSTFNHEQAEAFDRLAARLEEIEAAVAAGAARRPAGAPFMAPPLTGQPLVGRDPLLQQLKGQLLCTPASNLALHGLPGVGKTALAAHLAHDPELRARFPDGVLWAGLGPAPDVSSILSVWTAALGLAADDLAGLTTPEERAQALRAALGGRSLMIVIDDAWEAQHGLKLGLGGPSCAHVFTTRSPRTALDLAGEGACAVSELTTAEGAQVLSAMVPQLKDARAADLSALAEAVGGLPLSLMLIGHHLRREAYAGEPRRLQAAIDRLRDPHTWLNVGRPEAHTPSGVQSLQAVLSLTERALREPLRAALHALAAFPPKPNSFGDQAAQAVAAASLEDLDELVDHGLLEQAGPGRFCLHRAVHEYAAQAGDLSAGRRRLAVHYAAWIASHPDDFRRIDTEIGNLLVASGAAAEEAMKAELIQVAIGLFPYLEGCGQLQVAEAHARRAAEAAEDIGDHPAQVRLLLNAGSATLRLGHFEGSGERYAAALMLARAEDLRSLECRALAGLAALALQQGKHEEAAERCEEGLALAGKLGLKAESVALLSTLGSLELAAGGLPAAEGYLTRALEAAQQAADGARERGVRANLGVVAARRGERKAAEEHFEVALRLAYVAGSRRDAMALLLNLGSLATERGTLPAARARYEEALELARALSDAAQLALIGANLGYLLTSVGSLAEAQAALEEARASAHEAHRDDLLALVLINQAALARQQGELAAAQACLDEARPIAVRLNLRRYQTGLALEQAEVDLSQGHLGDARLGFEQARDGARNLQARDLEGRAMFGLAREADARGEPGPAQRLADEALLLLESSDGIQAEVVRAWSNGMRTKGPSAPKG